MSVKLRNDKAQNGGKRKRKLARPVTFAHKHVIKSDTPSRQIQSQFERDAAQDAQPWLAHL